MSLKTPDRIRTFQRKLYFKAKAEPDFRFYLLYDKIYREDILRYAYRSAKANGGGAGVDGITFGMIESKGLDEWLSGIREELKAKTYKPQPVRRVMIPKPGGKYRPLGIPTIRDRVIQTAAKLVIEPIFEADLEPNVYGYRPKRSALNAIQEVHERLCQGYTDVVDADLSKYLETSSYYTSFHERFSKRVGWVFNTLILKPFLFPDRRWTAESSPRFTRCNTVCLDTPRNLVASCMGT